MFWTGHREEEKTGEVSEAQGRGKPGRPQTEQNKQQVRTMRETPQFRLWVDLMRPAAHSILPKFHFHGNTSFNILAFLQYRWTLVLDEMHGWLPHTPVG